MAIKKLTEIMEIKGVPVYAHWSVLVIGALVLIGAIERPSETIAAWTSYFAVILIHECGHMVLAQRKGHKVFSIELYPILGFVRYQEPWSRYDRALIAWGGVAAQALVAVPIVTWTSIFGFTRSDAVNVAMGILGYYSLLIAALNLVPAPPLDGARAWYLIPELINKVKKRPGVPSRKVGWRGW
jgi:membrane-associated protease RseP (regulator of RpoE activity)